MQNMGSVTDANFTDANLNGVNMAWSHGTEWYTGTEPVTRPVFRRATLNNANLTYSAFKDPVFNGATASTGFNISRSRLEGGTYTGANFTGADFSYMSGGPGTTARGLFNVDFSGVGTLANANFSWSKFSNVRMSGANLTGASFNNTDLGGSTSFTGANLRNADVSYARAAGQSFGDAANLSGANFGQLRDSTGQADKTHLVPNVSFAGADLKIGDAQATGGNPFLGGVEFATEARGGGELVGVGGRGLGCHGEQKGVGIRGIELEGCRHCRALNLGRRDGGACRCDGRGRSRGGGNHRGGGHQLAHESHHQAGQEDR
jgi:uncharacterized protein YjbI with pentapeptide repeats